MYFLISFLVFIFGVCIGSFLNCVIYRLEQKKSLSGRSFCPRCKHTLTWQDLIPVFSFLFLRGKCKYCKKSISWQYPAVELATGMLFLLIFSAQGGPASGWNFLNLIFWFYIASVLIVIFVYDLKHYIIPDKILFPAIIITLVFRILEFFNLEFVSDFGFRASDFFPLGNYLLAALVGSGFFLLIFLISAGRWMGFGDVKLAILLSLVLGFPNILAGLFMAFFFGAIIGIILMVLNKKGLKSEIPFGPFLIAGTFLTLFWGSEIIQWYLKVFQI